MAQPTLFGCQDELRSGAIFSPCRTWRYALWRTFDSGLPTIAFCGLNPSTADETLDDPTIRRCLGFARQWNFGRLVMLNAYAFRSTDPKGLKLTADPVGPDNDEALATWSRQCKLVVAAWGVHCDPAREQAVCQAIVRPVHCLGLTKDGRPKHPLYLRGDTKPQLFWEPSTPVQSSDSR